MAQRSRFDMVRGSLLTLVGMLTLIAASRPAKAGLDDYVKKPDSAYAWSQTNTLDAPGGTITTLALTSQVWQGITWKHELTVYDPRELTHADAMLLFITGGDHNSKQNDNDHKQGFMLAHLCGARVAVLRQVPNQPLLGDKKEDELIAETFVRYLQTKDENWPLLFPMTKSAVRAMDALQAFTKGKGRPVERFVVTGGSKRGWTTWLTGAVDDRVVAIAPMVIVTLNMAKQGPNQIKVWGKYSEQIGDYVERGLTEKTDTPEGIKLWNMVDPLTYRDRLTKPKLLINGTNDRYWTLDALDLYWSELKGLKYLVELPNAGHGLDKNREWALGGIGAFFRHVITNRPMPVLTWSLARGAGGESTLTINASPVPVAARIWTARSETRDFRESQWESAPLTPAEKITRYVPKVSSGNLALFGELEFKIDGIPYHLTTSFFEPAVDMPGADTTRP